MCKKFLDAYFSVNFQPIILKKIWAHAQEHSPRAHTIYYLFLKG